MTARFALYFAPDDESPLGNFGATVLRRRASCASEWINPVPPVAFNDADVWQSYIKKPAHYGFHATIKAPFELADGVTVDQLENALTRFCTSRSSISLSGLAPRRTCRYDALAFDEQPQALKHLAQSCVETFEPFRAPLSDADIERRISTGLNEQQTGYLHKYGYPYVLDEFNFHMTLSGARPDNNAYFQWLTELYSSMVTQAPVLDRLCLFKQDNRQAPFTRISEILFPDRETARIKTA